MPDRIALREKDFGIWQEVSWADYWNYAVLVGHALLALGIEPGDRVAVHSENRREWLYSDIGAIAVRATTVGLYPTNPPAEVAYLLSHSGARVLIAEDQEQVDKALEVLDQLPELEKIIYLEPRGIRYRYTDPKLLSWEDFLALGAKHRESDPDAVDRRMAEAAADDVMTLVYTSGTTGPPKGAMLAVSNVEFCIKVLVEGGGFASPPPSPSDVMLSYLPLCHVAERVFTTWFSASAGIQVHFAESIETVQADLHEVQPTILFGVPRIWEKMLAGVQIRVDQATWLKRVFSRFWLRVADDIAATLVRTGGRHTAGTRVRYAVGWVFYYRALQDRIGVRKVRHADVGCRPDRAGSVAVLHGYRGADARGVRDDREHRDRNRQPAGPSEARHGRRAASRHRAAHRRDDWGNPHQASGNVRRVLEEPGGHRPDHRRRRLAAHRRRRRVGGRHVPEDHRPDEGPHHHRGRQERRAVGDRERAQGLAIHQGGHRDWRRAAVSDRVDRDRARHRRSLGADAQAALHHVSRPRREDRRCARSSSPSWTK